MFRKPLFVGGGSILGWEGGLRVWIFGGFETVCSLRNTTGFRHRCVFGGINMHFAGAPVS